MDQDLLARLQGIDNRQAATLAKLVLADMSDEDPAGDDDEQAAREQRDRTFVRDLIGALHNQESGEGSLGNLLVALYQQVPQSREAIERSLVHAEQTPETLDFGASALLGMLAVSLAAAIMRPRVRVKQQKDPGGGSETDIEIEIQGVKDVRALLKAVLPFL